MVAGATVEIVGYWPNFPPANVDPTTVMEAPDLLALSPPFYASRAAGLTQLQRRDVAPVIGQEKTLLLSADRNDPARLEPVFPSSATIRVPKPPNWSSTSSARCCSCSTIWAACAAPRCWPISPGNPWNFRASGTLELQEITRVWDALDLSYQLCISYEVSVIPIASARAARDERPVDSVITEYGVINLSEAAS